jgi:hypothetical protein
MREIIRTIRKSWHGVVSELAEDRTLVRWIAIFAGLQFLCALWDLPSSFGWENDGIAPRDFFGGIANNILPGRAHRYPLMHYFILGGCSLPVLLAAVVFASSWTASGIKAAILSVPSMTAISALAKLLTIGLGCILVLALASITRRGFGKRAARWCGLFLMTCMTFTYYARTSNLDVPSMAWAMLGIERISSYLHTQKRSDMMWSAFFCAAAVATKDPAYGLLVLPLLLVGLFAPWWSRTTDDWITHRATLTRAIVVGVVAYGVLSGAAINPTGFVARIDLLTGANSQDWATYTDDLAGLVTNMSDIASRQWEAFWPAPITGFAWLAVLWAVLGSCGVGRTRAAQRLLPFLLMLSALALFTLVVRRDDHRFIMPLCFGLAAYSGAFVAFLYDRLFSRIPQVAAMCLAAALLLACAGNTLRLVATQWSDPRNMVEAYIAALPEGAVVETYGLVVYQPRFDLSDDSPYRTQRVDKKPLEKRNPLAPTELQAPYMAFTQRMPDVLVITDSFASRFRRANAEAGRTTSAVVESYQADRDALEFFERADRDDLPGYALALTARSQFPAWLESIGFTPVRMHGSTANTVRVFRREEKDLPSDG